MSAGPPQIDALLADVDTLAENAVSEILGAAMDTTEPKATAPDSPAPRPSGPTPSRRPSPVVAGDEDIARILHLQVPIIVQLAQRTIPLSEILDLTTGSIIEFDKPADSELDLMINNKCIGQGQAVKVNENFGLRVTRVGSVRSRIQAMGGR